MRKIMLLVLALVILMGLTTTVAFAQDPERGKVVWTEEAFCQRCHGEMGEGVWGKPLAGDELTVEEWIAQVRSPRNRMPTFSEAQVSDDMIRDMYAYLTSLPAPTQTGFQDAGLAADAHPGQVLVVEKRCVACHTTTGPIGPFTSRNEMPTAEAVIAQLRNPKNRMPSFRENQVSNEEAAIIAEFLATQFTPQALPQSGSATAPYTMALPFLLGALLLAAGLGARQLKNRL